MRKLKLDQKKLMDHVVHGLNETQPGEMPWSNQTTCIGVIDGRQILLTVTRDNDDFVDRPSKKHICITEE